MALKYDHWGHDSLGQLCILLLQLIFFPCRFPEGFYYGISRFPLACSMNRFILLSTVIIMQGRDSLFFFRLLRLIEMELSQFSGPFNHVFPSDNNVLILGLVIEKPTLSLLLHSVFSVLFHQLHRCRGGISVTRADDQVTEAIMY